MTKLKSGIAALMLLLLSACATGTGEVPLGSLGQRVADAVVEVSDENRDLRVCWLAAGAVEVVTDLAQRSGRVEAQQSLGHLMLLQAAIDKARMTDSFWIETDTADVALLFASVLKDVGKTRLSLILLGGPTVTNFLDVARRTVVLTVKGHAVMRDINRVLQAVEDGEIEKVAAWKACEDRTAMNRNTLQALMGFPVSAARWPPGGGGVQMAKGYGWEPAFAAGPIDGDIDGGSVLAWPLVGTDRGPGPMLAEGWRDWEKSWMTFINPEQGDGAGEFVAKETIIDWSLGTETVKGIVIAGVNAHAWEERSGIAGGWGIGSTETMLSGIKPGTITVELDLIYPFEWIDGNPGFLVAACPSGIGLAKARAGIQDDAGFGV